MKLFNKLKFKPLTNGCVGVQAIHYFRNGYGVSVVLSEHSYGGDDGLYELAVMLGHKITYETTVTNDVEAYLTAKDVNKLMKQVKQLPNKAL